MAGGAAAEAFARPAWEKCRRNWSPVSEDIFLEGGDEAELIEQGRMEEIGERANFPGHLLEEGASFFEGTLRRFTERRSRMANLGEAQVDGENGLREAIVELAADAAALLVLEIEKLGGELMDGLLGVL